MKVNKILFPTDFSRCADQALVHALFLAKSFNSELHVLNVTVLFGDSSHYNEDDFPDIEEMKAKMREITDARMDKAFSDHDVENIKLVKAHERGISSGPAILEYAADRKIDLIVMGTHGRRGLEHIFLGSVAEEVVRRSKAPVLTIREAEKPKEIEAWEKILVPVDFSEHSVNALTYAKEIGKISDSKLKLLNIIEDTVPPAFSLTGKSSIIELQPDIIRKTKDKLIKLYNETPGPDIDHEISVKLGLPAHDIIKSAEEEEIDLIVIATHGLTGLDHFLMGSITEKIVRRANCPVFTVKAFGKSLLT